MANAKGFFTDTTVCIGCKACQVACHQWNQLPTNSAFTLTGNSYDNTLTLDAYNWRHVKFIEQFPDTRAADAGRWLMMSDCCKHCVQAGCLEVCPTGAIIRTEYDTVYIQQDVCNGCRNCVAGCPFGVVAMDKASGTAKKCTLCYDRLQNGLTPACAQACPTGSILFGDVQDLLTRARARVDQLHNQGRTAAYLYGDSADIVGGLNVFYLLEDKPEVYGLPSDPKLPSRNLWPSSGLSIVAAAIVALGAFLNFRSRRLARNNADQSA